MSGRVFLFWCAIYSDDDFLSDMYFVLLIHRQGNVN